MTDVEDFSCARCRLFGVIANVNRFSAGAKPRFGRGQLEIVAEDTFVALDPFSPRVAGKAANFVILGGICAKDGVKVCAECAVQVERRWLCLDCAADEDFEDEAVKMRIRKRLSRQ